MDKVKQQLNRDAEAAFNSGVGVDKAAVGRLADRFEAAFWEARSRLRELRALFFGMHSAHASEADLTARMRKLLEMPPEAM